MKLAYVVYKYDTNAGGVERYVYNLAGQMLEAGHELHLFASRALGVQDGIEAHLVPVNTLCAPTRDLSFAHNSAQMLRQESFDIIHGFSRTCYQDIYRIGGGSHWRYLLATHRLAGSAPGRALLKLNPRNRVIVGLEHKRYARRACRKLTAISEIAKREIVEDFGVDPDDISVIYNSVDIARFCPAAARGFRRPVRTYHGIVGDRPVALFAGTGFRRKGLRYLISALAATRKDARPFLLVAGRDDPAHMKRHASRCGVEQDVIFTGSVPMIEELYGAADYLVFPSLSDAFGQVVLEAMACGLPPVVSGLAGSSEIVEHGVNGLRVEDPKQVEPLAAALETMADPVRRKPLAAAAARTAAHFTLERNTEQTLQLYRAILAMKGRVGSVGAQK